MITMRRRDDEHHHEHSEIHAHYQFTCATPDALKTLDLANIFNTFPATQKIQVQLIGPSGQQGVEVTAKAAALKFLNHLLAHFHEIGYT